MHFVTRFTVKKWVFVSFFIGETGCYPFFGEGKIRPVPLSDTAFLHDNQDSAVHLAVLRGEDAYLLFNLNFA